MTVKVGQLYKGKMSGTIREVVDVVEATDVVKKRVGLHDTLTYVEHPTTLVHMYHELPNGIQYYSWWNLTDVERCCTLLSEED